MADIGTLRAAAASKAVVVVFMLGNGSGRL